MVFFVRIYAIMATVVYLILSPELYSGFCKIFTDRSREGNTSGVAFYEKERVLFNP